MGPARSMTRRRHHGPHPPPPRQGLRALGIVCSAAGVFRQDSHGRIQGGSSLLARAQCNARPQTLARPWGKRRSATETPFRGRA